MQMQFIEVFASVLAEKLMSHGTKIYFCPDEIKWPDGTLSKPCESKGLKGRKKKKNPTGKDGVYAKIVHEYGGRKNSKPPSDEANNVIVVNVDANNDQGAGDQPKKKNRGTNCMAFIN